MQLTVGTGRTATQVMEARTTHCAEHDGWLIKPPLSRERLAHAALVTPPGQTVARDNFEMATMRQWLVDLADQGANREQLWKAWTYWDTPYPRGKQRLRSLLDELAVRVDAREAELIAKSDIETQAERFVGAAHAKLEMAQAEERQASAEHSRAQQKVAAAKAGLEKAEAALKAQQA